MTALSAHLLESTKGGNAGGGGRELIATTCRCVLVVCWPFLPFDKFRAAWTIQRLQ